MPRYCPAERSLQLYRPEGLEEVRLSVSTGARRHKIPPHRHEETLFSQVLEGEVHFVDRCSGTLLRAGPGDLVILPSASVVSGEFGSHRAWRVRTMGVNQAQQPGLAHRSLSLLKAGRHELVGQFADIFRTLASEAAGSERRQLLRRWLDAVTGNGFLREQVLPTSMSPESLSLLDKVRRCIEGQPDRAPTLEQLGRLAGWHPHHLQRLFRQRYGVTPSQHHAHRRTEAALKMLAEGIPSAQVALRLGFSDQSHFIRVFRRHTGVTPGAVSTDRGLQKVGENGSLAV